MSDLAALTLDRFAATVGDVYAAIPAPEPAPVAPAPAPAGADAAPADADADADAGAPSAGPVELVLLAATAAAGEPAAPDARQPFALLFGGPPLPGPLQQVVALDHPALGRLELFLVAVAREADGMRYEAVFG